MALVASLMSNMSKNQPQLNSGGGMPAGAAQAGANDMSAVTQTPGSGVPGTQPAQTSPNVQADPAMMADVLQLGGKSRGMDPAIQAQQAQAKRMRDMSQQGMGLIDAGKLKVAPSWANLVASGLHSYGAGKAERESQDMQKQQNEIRNQQIQRMMEAMLKQQGQPQQQQQGGGMDEGLSMFFGA